MNWFTNSGLAPTTAFSFILSFQTILDTTRMAAAAEITIPLNLVDECRDIKAFLWETTRDLTSLPLTVCIFAVIYTFIITLGIVGNSLVILSVLRNRSLQSVRNIFIVSLSCSDIVVSIVSGTITPITAFTKVWLFGATLCKLVPVIQGASLCFSTLTLTAISIDRFILIIYPTKRSIQKHQAFQMIAINCIIAVSISSPMFFKQTLVYYKDFCGQFCSEDWGNDQSRSTYGTIVLVLQFVLPFFVITYSYLMISLKLSKGMMVKKKVYLKPLSVHLADSLDKKKSNENGNSFSISTEQKNNCSAAQISRDINLIGKPVEVSIRKYLHSGSNGYVIEQCTEKRRQALKRRLRTTRMLMAMVGVFLCCWTPYVGFNFLRDYQWLPSFVLEQEYLCGIITHCISMSSTVWNPILYALLNKHFCQAFMKLLRQGSLRRQNNKAHKQTACTFSARIRRYSEIISNAYRYSVSNCHRAIIGAFTIGNAALGTLFNSQPTTFQKKVFLRSVTKQNDNISISEQLNQPKNRCLKIIQNNPFSSNSPTTSVDSGVNIAISYENHSSIRYNNDEIHNQKLMNTNFHTSYDPQQMSSLKTVPEQKQLLENESIGCSNALITNANQIYDIGFSENDEEI